MTAHSSRAVVASLAVAAVSGFAFAAGTPRDLPAALRAIIDESALSGSRTGILVVSLDSGQVIYAKDPDVLLNPASNVKLFTAAAALARLGPGYRFETEFYADAASAGKAAVKTLFIRGKGDPTMVTERLYAAAGELAHLGIARIGDVVVDDGWFDREREGPGYDQERGDRPYLAPTGALSLNFNTVAIHVAPGDRTGRPARVEVEPASDFFVLEKRTVTGPPRNLRRVVPSSEPLPNGRQRITVSGRIPVGGRDQVVYRKIDDPAAYFGHTFRRLLELRGVKVSGKVRPGTVPPNAKLLYVAESEELGEVVRRMNKSSSNFVAEQLVKTLGAEAKGAPGSWGKGIDAIEDFLAEIGIPRGAYVMRNGSGLNDTNRFSARQTVALLRAMWTRFPLAFEYVDSLPVAGRDGTIRFRMEGTDAVGRLRAKTGTLENVTSLSGYVETAGHERLAFAILVNDYPGRHAQVVRAVDAIGSALAASGSAAGLSAAVAAAAPPAVAPLPAGAPGDGLRTAVGTYYALGRAGDRRNLSFLRTALRTEADPSLRMAIGECVYLSDPDGESARRALLDAIDPRALARLFAAAGGNPPPVLSSLGDLAADGNGEALARLIEIAGAAASAPSGDPRLADALADVLADVAGAAPDELLKALRAAPAPATDAAVLALGRGIVRGGEEEHPVAAAFADLGQRDGEAGAFARAVAARLREAEAAARAPRIGPGPDAPLPAAPVPASVPAAERRSGG